MAYNMKTVSTVLSVDGYANYCFEDGDAIVQAKNLKNLLSFIDESDIDITEYNIVWYKDLIENKKICKMVETLMDSKDSSVYLGIEFFYYLVLTYNSLYNNKYKINDVDIDPEKLMSVTSIDDDNEYNQFVSINSGRDIDTRRLFLSEVGRYPLYTAEEEKAALEKYANSTGYEKDLALEDIVNHNMRLVVAIAKKYEGRGVSKEDLQQEGAIGLMTAIKKFDLSRNCRLSTYATPWIHQAASRAIAEYSRNVRMPVHSHEDNIKIKKFVSNYYQTCGRYPSIEEIVDGTLLTREKVSFLLSCGDEVSLNAYVNGGEGEADTELGEFIVDGRYDENYNIRQLVTEEFRKTIYDCGLKERELEVIIERFGLEDGIPKTLEEVGKMFNVTRERIRQIEAKALRKLRIVFKKKGYRPEDFSVSNAGAYVPTVKRR